MGKASESEVWLIGAGPMAQAYAQVLRDQKREFTVIGRGQQSATAFEEALGIPVVTGGLASHLDRAPGLPRSAIVATAVEQLAPTAVALINAGLSRVLIEKPAGLDPQQTTELAALAGRSGASCFVAYNRRYFASTQLARTLIEEDGGALSFRFEFSELAQFVSGSKHAPAVKANWLYANSSHVLDMAFFLAGFPTGLHAQVSGELAWHPAGARFTGHGVSATGALFSYIADWASAPRWAVEVYTGQRALTLQPLEQLRSRPADGFKESPVALDDDLDRRFKPGVWRQTLAFLDGGDAAGDLLEIHAHAAHMAGPFRTIRESGSYQD
jgi:predicted dehydrogenase